MLLLVLVSTWVDDTPPIIVLIVQSPTRLALASSVTGAVLEPSAGGIRLSPSITSLTLPT